MLEWALIYIVYTVWLVGLTPSALLQHVTSAVNTRLSEVFSWNTLEVRENGTEDLLEPGQFVPASNMPVSIELWTDRVFFAVPRDQPGVLATLVSFKINCKCFLSTTTFTSVHFYSNIKTLTFKNWSWISTFSIRFNNYSTICALQSIECIEWTLRIQGTLHVSEASFEEQQYCLALLLT